MTDTSNLVTLNVNGATFSAPASECATVEALIDLYRDVANIPRTGVSPLVDGAAATGSTPLAGGETVSLSKPAGAKG